MIAARQPGAFFSNRLAFFLRPQRFFRKTRLMIPYGFVASGHQIPPKKSRRASRAGLLHFPIVLLVLSPKYPKIFPARFARRVASFSYGLLLFDHK